MGNTRENVSQFQIISARFQSIFNFLVFSIPFVNLTYWLLFNHLPSGLTTQLLPIPVNSPLSVGTLFFCFVISLIPTISAMFGIVSLKNLFKLYGKAIIFSKENAAYILRFGYSLVAWVAAKVVFIALISIVLTLQSQFGEQTIIIQVDISDIVLLIAGAVVILISWVMKEATIINEEQKYTI